MDKQLAEFIKIMTPHMAEQYMRHDYRSMWEIWEMLTNKVKKSKMALLTDDQDIRDVRMYVEHGGNGDYYLNLVETKFMSHSSTSHSVNMRISTSGGNAPSEVKIAVANLFRAMEAAGLNNHPVDDKR